MHGDAVDVVARLKQESEVPLRSHGSLSMNRALMAAGLVDRVQVTLFPVITGQTGTDSIPPPGSRRAHAVQLASEDHGPARFHSPIEAGRFTLRKRWSLVRYAKPSA